MEAAIKLLTTRPAETLPMREKEIVLFVKEVTKASQPLLTGKVMFGGTEYAVSLWQETSKKDNAKVYFKGVVREPFQYPAAPADTPSS